MKYVPSGALTVATEENCLSVRVGIWFRVRIRVRVEGQFSSGAIVLEPFQVNN